MYVHFIFIELIVERVQKAELWVVYHQKTASVMKHTQRCLASQCPEPVHARSLEK